MLDYLLLVLASFFMALQFVCVKLYQNEVDNSLRNSLIFNSVQGITTAFVFFAANGFKLGVCTFSVGMATMFSLLVVIYTAIGFVIIEKSNVSIYTVFLMTGGMLVPYIWGLILRHEHFSLLWTAVVLLIAAYIFYSNKKCGKVTINILPLCIMVFILNGFVSVVSKEHQISKAAVDTTSFVILSGLANSYISAPLLLFVKNKNKKSKQTKKSILFIVLAAVISGLGSFMQLSAAVRVPATVVFPTTTAGTMIFTALFNGFITKILLKNEKLK